MSSRGLLSEQPQDHTYVLGVVEEPTVPQIVISTPVVVEVAAVRAVELIQSISRILAGVAVNHVEQNDDSLAMGDVDQLLQLIRRPIATETDRIISLISCYRAERKIKEDFTKHYKLSNQINRSRFHIQTSTLRRS